MTADAADREAFLAAVRADPADNLPKQIYADYLGERGDPAELAWRAPWRRDGRYWRVDVTGINATHERYKRFDAVWSRLQPWFDVVRGGRQLVNAAPFLWFDEDRLRIEQLAFESNGFLSGICDCRMRFREAAWRPGGLPTWPDARIDRRGFAGLVADVMSVVLDLPPPATM